jgi:hypothetical protein
VTFKDDYRFKCDQIVCPCCSNTHTSPGYYVSYHPSMGTWYVKHFSKKCSSLPLYEEKQELPSFAFKL